MFKIDTAGENIVYTDTDLNVKFCIPANDCSGMKYTQEISSLNEKEDIKKHSYILYLVSVCQRLQKKEKVKQQLC